LLIIYFKIVYLVCYDFVGGRVEGDLWFPNIMNIIIAIILIILLLILVGPVNTLVAVVAYYVGKHACKGPDAIIV
jgi:hypothetical protein